MIKAFTKKEMKESLEGAHIGGMEGVLFNAVIRLSENVEDLQKQILQIRKGYVAIDE